MSDGDWDWDWDWPAWTWTGHGQSTGTRGLRQDLAGARETALLGNRQLRAELSKATGSLQERLDRLAAAFDAFVELGDLRVSLSVFDEEAGARHHARLLFAGRPRWADVRDVEGYWLPAALLAVAEPAGGGHLAVALQRDRERAAVFHVLTAAVLGRGESVTAALLGETLPALTAAALLPVRAVWTLAADGCFGVVGRRLAQQRGAEFFAASGEDDREAAVAAWQRAVAPDPDAAFALPKELSGATELRAIGEACDRLAVLREWVAEGLSAPSAQASEPVPDPVVRRTLELLVDEGSPQEQELLARERELRKAIEGTGRSSGTWRDPAGETAALLRADVTDAERPGRRAVVIRSSARHLLAAAEGLAEQGSKRLPEVLTVRTRRGQVALTAAGPVAGAVEKAAARSHTAVDQRPRQIGLGLSALGAVLLLLSVLLSWGWAIPAIGALAASGAYLAKDRRTRDIARLDLAATEDVLRTDTTRATAALVRATADLERRRARVEDDLGAVRALLA